MKKSFENIEKSFYRRLGHQSGTPVRMMMKNQPQNQNVRILGVRILYFPIE